jgi:hypothetical protein
MREQRLADAAALLTLNVALGVAKPRLRRRRPRNRQATNLWPRRRHNG